MALAYKRFGDAGEASSFLQQTQGARTLGGGTLLVRRVNEGETAIDTYVRLTDPALRRMDTSGDTIRLGAAVTMAQVAAHADLGFVASAARGIGGPAVRTAATIGGNLFAPSPYGDFGVALLALDASAALIGPEGPVEMPLEAFFRARDGLPPGTIVTGLSFPRPSAGSFRFVKVSRVRPKGAAVVSIAAVVEEKDGLVSRARVAFGAMAETPVRAHAFEAALTGSALTRDTLDRVLPAAVEGTAPASDPVASQWYRRAVLPVHLSRLLLASL